MVRAGAAPITLRDGDGPLLDALARDGRASYAALAAATGWSQGVVARRAEALSAAGVLYFDIDLATQLTGKYPPTSAMRAAADPGR